MKKRILSIFLAALMVISLLPVTAFAAATTEVANFAALKSACTESSGIYKLNGDVKFTADIEIDSDFKLDLNDCVLNLNGNMLIVSSGKTFELYDTSGTKTTRYYNKDATTGLWTLAADQTEPTDYTTTGGVITGGNANFAAVNVSGTFIMHGGNISGNKGRARGSVSVNATGTFTMEDGNISGNATTGDGKAAGGSGVNVGGGMFTMKKGTISKNTAVGDGGNSGVFVNSGSTVVLGGTAKIIGNKSGTGEGETTKNLCLWDGAKITLGTGADVPAAGMSVGVTMWGTGPFTVPASGAEEAQSYFFADDIENNEFGYDDNSTPGDKTDDFLKLTARHAITNETKSADAGTNHGYITVEEKATVGTTVTVTVTPNEGYTLKSLIWYPTTMPSNTHDITAEKSFTMYDFRITVKAEFESALPNIKVTKVSGVEDPVSGTAMSETQFYNIETNNFAGTPSLTLQWKNGETWDGTAPTGVTLTVDGKLTTTAAAPEGSYYFRITNGLADGAEGFVSSGQTMLNVSAAEKVATPTANPAAGTYTTGQSVTLSTTTDGASIYYTTDDTTPTTSSTQYTGAIAVNTTTTIKAIAVKAYWTDSDMLTATYTINNGPSDSGDSEPTYMIALETAKNGTFTVNKKSAYAGQTVTITVAPDKGFTLETLTVLDRSGREVKVKSLGNNKYSFAMPASKVTVSVSFMEDNTMLNFFVDVKAEDYFYDAVLWAAENGITQGTDAVHFSPNAPVTRAQVVTFLWRAAGSPEPAGGASKFTDLVPNEYYVKAVAWAIEQKITKGITDTTFEPETVCTRGQIVTFLARFAGVEDADTESVFTDVPATEFFAAAVKWAKDNGVTDGMTATTFEPYANCARAQVVTFLYRWMVK